MPQRVVAWTRTQLHAIETEDTAQAMLEWPNGALGTLHVSTDEAGPAFRLGILGTSGYLTIGRERLEFLRFASDMREFVARSSSSYSRPESHAVPVEVDDTADGHLCIHENLHDAILRDTPLIADGSEGRMSLELANAMIYSSYTETQVELPLDRGAYTALLEALKTGHLEGHRASFGREQ
jgi:predicted dehydrogenase